MIPQSILEQNLPPEAYDARLPLSKRQIEKANLSAYRRAAQQESGLRTALWRANRESDLCFRFSPFVFLFQSKH